jgi:exodeoxyribonuclease VII small subunit
MKPLEEQLARLEAIVGELEREKIDLSRALLLFEEGVGCLRDSAAALAEADTKVKRLTELAKGTFVVEEISVDE